MDAALAMLTDRPYVLAFLAAFLVVSVAERGAARTLFWLASGTGLGWLAEVSSIRNGFPFGHYTYHGENFPTEAWPLGVPLFASLSFAFLSYFGYSVAYTLLSPLHGKGAALRRVEDRELSRSGSVLILAAVITTWLDTVTDPVAHLGKYWFLGDLYAYHSVGFHFHVPLSNYLGWIATSLGIVFVNQRFDAGLGARESAPVRGFALPFKPLWATGSCLGNFAFILGINLSLLCDPSIPASEPLLGVFVSGLILTGAFVIFAALMLRRGIARGAGLPG